jgi:hypothetical protein
VTFAPAATSGRARKEFEPQPQCRLKRSFVDRSEAPVYLRIADKASHLRGLGMSDRAIAGALGVPDKTVAKAIPIRPSSPLNGDHATK